MALRERCEAQQMGAACPGAARTCAATAAACLLRASRVAADRVSSCGQSGGEAASTEGGGAATIMWQFAPPTPKEMTPPTAGRPRGTEERRVGTECVRTWRVWGAQYH